jgi:23S rRNA 5-hydroxycytidine C2501 synthase
LKTLKSSLNRIELLAPARTAASGIIAVNFGADAVYTGAPLFSARKAAGNSVTDIERLANYAHRYYARVYVALNTILFDNELDTARHLIRQLYEAGADALIIQDMGILQMDLPPVELHASTQTNNYDPARIRFLEEVGFSRIILARELTLEQIRKIREVTTCELESFVHGALCVSMSGQCYMSESQGGRSGNRGVCAQPCRKLYDLTDSRGKIIQRQKHLLSLKDLDLSDHLPEMAFAGISSFKIEGRLKDDNYLKNVTAFYRKRLDTFLEGTPGFVKSSSGTVTFDFIPDPVKTFSRGSTDYFLNGRNKDIVSFDTAKSAGEFAGTVQRVEGKKVTIRLVKEINNNDGLTYFTEEGNLEGVKVNTAVGNEILLAGHAKLKPGSNLYRNYDHAFSEKLKGSRTIRKVRIEIRIEIAESIVKFNVTDEDGVSFEMEIQHEGISASQPEKAAQVLREQMARSGGTVFEVGNVSLSWKEPIFIPVSVINQMRRDLLEAFLDYRLKFRPMPVRFIHRENAIGPDKSVSFLGNVSNRLAKKFYEKHGAENVEPALELSRDYKGRRLMTMKHCLKYQLGFCPREGNHLPSGFAEPLYLTDGDRKFRLEFDCRDCRMNLFDSAD